MKKQRQQLHGWLALDKPLGFSSTQALGKARWLLNADKAGHGGTLDPLASGVLPIAFGEATKTIPWVMDGQKTYDFTVKWGSETETDDLEGKVTKQTANVASQQSIETILYEFIGAVQQIPPAYSAIKVSGDRAYDLARSGETVELSPRTINIDSLLIKSHRIDTETTFRVTCGKGTYVRALARDMGRRLGCLGHVTYLRRVGVGPFREENAISLEKLTELCQSAASENSLAGILRPIETVLDGIPALAVMEPEARRLQQGQRVPVNAVALLPGLSKGPEAEVVLVTCQGKPVGIFKLEHSVLKTVRLFNL